MNPDYKIYDSLYIEARSKGWTGWGGNARMERTGELVSRLFSDKSVPTAGKLLELGCGEGAHSRLLAHKGYEVTGIDISETAIQWAKEKSANQSDRIKYITADLTIANLAFADAYDVVVDGNCLHCVIGLDRQTFLNNVSSALAHRGIFFVSSLCSKTAVNESILQNGIPYRHIATVENLILELEASGFDIVKTVVHERQRYNHVNIHAAKRIAE